MRLHLLEYISFYVTTVNRGIRVGSRASRVDYTKQLPSDS